MTKKDATAAKSGRQHQRPARTQVVRTPLRFADRSSNPVERSCRPEPLAWSQ